MLPSNLNDNATFLNHRPLWPASWVERVGIIGLYLFALSSMASVSAANIGLGLMLLSFIVSSKAWRSMSHEPIFWLCLTLIVYISLRAIWAAQEFPSISNLPMNRAKSWILLFLFFIVGWWLAGDSRHTAIVLVLALAGFTLGILSSPDASLLLSLIPKNVRSGMHYDKAILFGFHCAVMILGLLVFAPRWLRRNRQRAPWVPVFLAIATLVMALFFLQGMIISQSRGVWLAALVVIPVTAFLFHRKSAWQHANGKRRWLLWLLIPAVVTLVAATNWNLIWKRLSPEGQTLTIVLQQGLDKAPLSSSSYRLSMWRFGIEKWSERPIFGWGPGSTQLLVEQEPEKVYPHPSGEPWDHLHSVYVELLLQLGLTGAALVAAIIVLLTKGVVDAYRSNRLPRDLFYFFTACLALTAIYSLTDFRHLQWNWRFFWLLFAGIGFASQMNPASR